jgi:hybrid cluster-associated redox disulfide protein
MLTFLLFTLLVAVAGYAWLVHLKTKGLVRRLDQVNDRLYSWGGETRQALALLEERVRALEFEKKRDRGEFRVTPDMLIADVLTIHPRMKEVLAAMHLGGCSSCSTSKAETLGEGAASYNLDIEGILREIEDFMKDPEGYQAEPKPHGGPAGLMQIQIPSAAGSS